MNQAERDRILTRLADFDPDRTERQLLELYRDMYGHASGVPGVISQLGKLDERQQRSDRRWAALPVTSVGSIMAGIMAAVALFMALSGREAPEPAPPPEVNVRIVAPEGTRTEAIGEPGAPGRFVQGPPGPRGERGPRGPRGGPGPSTSPSPPEILPSIGPVASDVLERTCEVSMGIVCIGARVVSVGCVIARWSWCSSSSWSWRFLRPLATS